MGIRFKIILPLLITFVSFILLTFFQWVPSQIERAEKEFNISQQQILGAMESDIIRHVLARDYAALFASIDEQMDRQKKQWRQLTLHLASGRRLYPLFPVEERDDLHQFPNLMTIYHEISLAGKMIVRMSLKADWSERRRDSVQSAYELCLYFGIPFFVFLVISYLIQDRSFRRPLLLLTKSAKQIAEGNYKVHLPKPSKDEIGALTRMFRTMRENLEKSNTELHQAMDLAIKKEDFQRSVFESMAEGVISMNESGNITSANIAAEAIFRYERDGMLGLHFKKLMPERRRKKYDRYLKYDYLTHQRKHNIMNNPPRMKGVRSDGEHFPIEIIASQMQLHDRRTFIAVIRDITEREKADRDLLEAKLMAESANRAKSYFLAGMSHEIRTPMNTIMGVGDLLLESPLTEEQRKYVQISKSAGENLLTLINDILDLSKIEAGQITLEKTQIDLSSILAKVCDLVSVKAEDKRIPVVITMRDDVPADLVGDPQRLMQVILNLVNNAIKFTERGEIVILVEMIKERLDLSGNKTVELRFSVSDTGIGVAANKLDLIFDKFTQADSSTTRKYGGTGLGLHISKRLVELLGGTIWLESEPGEGSTFFFTGIFGKDTSAIAVPARTETQTGESFTGEVRPLQILLVEDSEDNRLLLLTFLKRTPHKVEIAVNGAEAVDKFKSGQYDLVFMDIQMPVMDGYTASAKIREWESETGARPTPLVALTAHAMKEDELKSLEAGCDSHLTKPIKKSVLLEAIRRYASVEEDV